MTRSRNRILPALLALLTLLWALPLSARAADLPEDVNASAEGISWSAVTSGGETITQDSYSDKLRLLVFFGISGSCSNSNSTLRGLAQSSLADNEDFQIIAIGCRLSSVNPSADALERYMDNIAVNDRITYAWSTGGGLAALSYLKAAGIISPDYNIVSYAVNIVLDGEGRIRYAWTGGYSPAYYQAIQAALSGGAGSGEPDPQGTYTVKLSGTFDYAAAWEELALINSCRAEAGVSPITLDAELTQAAMQRAAEIAVYYSHTRPDNSHCSTVSSKANRENIAVNYRSVEEVMDGWMNSTGHRKNLLASDNQCGGIGCFTDGDGVKYWVQLFSSRPGSEAGIPDTPQTGTAAVDTAMEYLELPQAEHASLSLQTWETEQQRYLLRHFNPGFSFASPDLQLSYAASSDEAVAAVFLADDGTVSILAVGPGEAEITLGLADPLGGSPWILYTIDLTVSGAPPIPLLDAGDGETQVGSLLISPSDEQTVQFTVRWEAGTPDAGASLYLAVYDGQALTNVCCGSFQDGVARLSGLPLQLLQGSYRLMVLDASLRPLAQPLP